MFSAHVKGSCTTLRMASHTPFSGSMQTLKGSSSTYSQAMKKPTGQPRNMRMMNHSTPHSSPGHRPPDPDPDPDAIQLIFRCLQSLLLLEVEAQQNEAVRVPFNTKMSNNSNSFCKINNYQPAQFRYLNNGAISATATTDCRAREQFATMMHYHRLRSYADLDLARHVYV